jgi:hypothetical protein
MTRDFFLDMVQAQLRIAKVAHQMATIAIATAERILAESVPSTDAPTESEGPETPAPSTRPDSLPEEQGDEPISSEMETPATCPHPRENAIPSKVMGRPNRYFCTKCGVDYDRT